MIPVMKEADEAKKKELMEKAKTETVPQFLMQMDKALKSNGGNFLVGSGLTWADISLAQMLRTMSSRMSDAWEKGFPALVAYRDAVFGQPKIKNEQIDIFVVRQHRKCFDCCTGVYYSDVVT